MLYDGNLSKDIRFTLQSKVIADPNSSICAHPGGEDMQERAREEACLARARPHKRRLLLLKLACDPIHTKRSNRAKPHVESLACLSAGLKSPK